MRDQDKFKQQEMLKYYRGNKKSQFVQTVSYYLSSIDLFGKPPSLRIMRKERYTSKIGIVLSLTLIATVLIYTIISIKNLSSYANPSVISSQYQFIESSVINTFSIKQFPLMNNNYTLVVSITDSNFQHTIEVNRHVIVTARQCKRTRIPISDTNDEAYIDQKCFDYPLETCTMENFKTPKQYEYFSKFPLGTQQCLSKEQVEHNPPVIQGFSQAVEYQYFTLFLQACQNTTNFTSCAPQEEIDERLTTGYYVVHQTDYLLSLDNPDNPFEEIISLNSMTFSITSSKTLYSQVQLQTAKTDIGIITSSNNEQYSIPLYLMRETQEIYNNKYLVQHLLRFDNKATIYTRSYEKLQTMLGTIGGLYQVLFLILELMMKRVQNILMSIEMANKLFSFEKSETGVNKSVSEKRDIRNTFDLKQYIQSKQKSINAGVYSLLKVFFGFNSPMKTQLEYASEKFMSKLDISYIINKIYEIDKLKYILLNTEQQNLFNYLPKPTIPQSIGIKRGNKTIIQLESVQAYKFILQDEKSDLLKLSQAFKSYQKINSQKEKTHVDQQILSFLDNDLIEIFNQLIEDQSYANNVFQEIPNAESIHSPDIESLRKGLDINQMDEIVEQEFSSLDRRIQLPKPIR